MDRFTEKLDCRVRLMSLLRTRKEMKPARSEACRVVEDLPVSRATRYSIEFSDERPVSRYPSLVGSLRICECDLEFGANGG